MNELIKYDEIVSIVSKYKNTLNHLNEILVAEDKYNTTVKNNNLSYLNFIDYRKELDDMEIRIKYKFICDVLNFDKLSNILTNEKRIKMQDEISKIANNKSFDITESAAHDIISSLMSNAQDIVSQIIKDMYMFLTNNQAYKVEFKSVKTWKVGNRVIFKENSPYHLKDQFNDIERVFDLVMGKRRAANTDFKFPYDAFMQQTEGESEYFTYKLHKNNSVHIKFIDLDTLDIFNRRVGKLFNWIKK